jgi:hypothetical protein
MTEGLKDSHKLAFFNIKRYPLQRWKENFTLSVSFFDALCFE